MGAKNVEHLHIWALGSGNTGLSGNMAATLYYYEDETSRAAASESVTIAEIGSGDYAIYYTPLSAGTYKLKVTESSLSAETWFEDIVTDAPTTATSGDSYCAESDVVAFAQFASDFSGSTTPTETQVLNFMQLRAAEIYGRLRRVMGSSATGPSNYATSISTSSDAGLALSRVCKMANAVGAAMDALEAAGANEAPAQSDRVAELGVLYASFFVDNGPLETAARQYIGSGNLAATHISTGEVTEKSVSSVEETGLTFDMGTQF